MPNFANIADVDKLAVAIPAAEWNSYNEAQKQGAIDTVHAEMNGIIWEGEPAKADQPDAWPRKDVDPPADGIPADIVTAEAWWAIIFAQDKLNAITEQTSGHSAIVSAQIESVAAQGLSYTYRKGTETRVVTEQNTGHIPVLVFRIIQKWLAPDAIPTPPSPVDRGFLGRPGFSASVGGGNFADSEYGNP